MDYQLAKQLKNAGFPQYEQGRGYFLVKDRLVELPSGLISGVDVAYVPTLFELIKACGDKFKKLLRRSNNTYSAFAGTKSNRDRFYRDGITPEEAVAKLWLALNAKE